MGVFLDTEKDLCAVSLLLHPNCLNPILRTNLSSGCGAVDERCPQRFEALQMVAMDMAQEACQRWRPLWVFSKVIDYCRLETKESGHS